MLSVIHSVWILALGALALLLQLRLGMQPMNVIGVLWMILLVENCVVWSIEWMRRRRADEQMARVQKMAGRQ